MAKNKKTPSSEETAKKASPSGRAQKTSMSYVERIKSRIRGFLSRRPHRSFRWTHRRDYVRSLKLPGYWAFTGSVRKILWQHKRLFLWLAVVYGVLNAALVGLVSQDTYSMLSDTLAESGQGVFDGGGGKITEAVLLLGSGVVGMLNQVPTDTQRIFAAMLGLLSWLATIWLLRAILAGHKPKLRDALYNGGAPILATLLIAFVIVLQLIPIALAAIGFSAANSAGLLDSGVEAMMFWVFAGLLSVASLYWMTSSLMALVVVTLPGMYPMQALKTAGDLVIGRRIRILLRLLWAVVIVMMCWVLVMIPIILLDERIKDIWPTISWVPVVPTAILILSSLTVVWMASYIYLLYRRIVDDDAAPA